MYPWQIHFKDYFSLLEVSPNASEEVIHAAYKVLIKKYHPDTQTNLTDEQKESFYLKTQDLNEAYEVLKDKEQYSVYKADVLEYYNKQMKRGDLFSYHYLKSWQNSLIKSQKDQELQIKNNPQEKSYKNQKKLAPELEDLLNDLYNATQEKEVQNIVNYLSSMNLKTIQLVLETFFKRFSKILLVQEAAALELILKSELWVSESIIKRAFKYKFLYASLFPYIQQKRLISFYDRVRKIAYNTYFSSQEALDFTLPLVELCEIFMDKKELKGLKKSIIETLKKEKKQILTDDNKDTHYKYLKVLKGL